MNTIKSVYYGWGTLIVAGGGAYYFAKQSINADRAAKAEADRQKRVRQFQLEQQAMYGAPPPQFAGANTTTQNSVTAEVGKLRREGGNGNGIEDDSNPSSQASQDPAPTRHAPTDAEQKASEKSKYEASDVYRSRKGDRFS